MGRPVAGTGLFSTAERVEQAADPTTTTAMPAACRVDLDTRIFACRLAATMPDDERGNYVVLGLTKLCVKVEKRL